MKCLLSLWILLTGAACAQASFLAEGLMSPGVNLPYCVTDVNTAMPTRNFDSRGGQAISYRCELAYSHHPVDAFGRYGTEELHATRAHEFKTVPGRARVPRRGSGVLAQGPKFVIFGVHQHALRTLLGTAEQLSEVFQVEATNTELRLTSVRPHPAAAAEVSCLVTALELLAAACDGHQDGIRTAIIQRIQRAHNEAARREYLRPRLSAD